jgi:hypothetical protein
MNEEGNAVRVGFASPCLASVSIYLFDPMIRVKINYDTYVIELSSAYCA